MIRGRTSGPAALGGAGLALALGACRISFDAPPDDPLGPGSGGAPFELTVAGRAERSLAVTLTARRDTTPIPREQVVLSASPSSAVQFRADGSALLLETGRVLFVATVAGRADTVAVDVVAPPTVVFDRVEGDGHHIYSVALDGRSLTRLTNGTSDDVHPTVGGGRVAFASYAAGQADIRSVSPTGGAVTTLTNTPGAQETEPALSRDGTRLAYVRSGTASLGGAAPRLWTSAGDGSGAAAASASSGTAETVDGAPHWAPAGDRVVFMSTASGSAQLYVLVPQTGVVRALGVGAAPNVEPAWNAAGTAVAFRSERAGAAGLYQADGTTGAAVWLTRGGDGEPAWTADGRLVYTRYENGVGRLRWVDPAEPSVAYDISTGPGSAAHPAVVP